MKNIKRKIENTPSNNIKGIFQESNIFLSQRQPKNLLRLLSNSCISRNPILPKGIFKCNDEGCNITFSLKCKFCMYETYIGKTFSDHTYGFKTRMNNHITKSRSGVSTCKFPIHVFNCIKRNNRQLE